MAAPRFGLEARSTCSACSLAGSYGRTRSLGEKDVEVAKTLLANPDITVEAVAARLGVAPATLYRYLPGGRGGLDALGE